MELEKVIDEAISKYPTKVVEYKNGNIGIIGLFIGETMKLMKGNADPKEVNRIIKEKLGK